MPLTSAERKRAQRKRDRLDGFVETTVRVHKSDKPKILRLARELMQERTMCALCGQRKPLPDSKLCDKCTRLVIKNKVRLAEDQP